MKSRTGFVSNSSSSSFVILGLEWDYEDFKNIVKEKHATILKEKYGWDGEDATEQDEAADAFITDGLPGFGDLVACFDMEECDDLAIGILPSTIGGNETIDEASARAQILISDFVGEQVPIKDIEFTGVIDRF
jgi:hypothetical protein